MKTHLGPYPYKAQISMVLRPYCVIIRIQQLGEAKSK